MTPTDLAIAAAVMAVGATVQGSIGFGLNVIAAPILLIIDPMLIPGPALAAAFVLVVLVAVRDHASIYRPDVPWVFAGRIPGTIVGSLAVAALPARGLALAIAAAVLFGVVLSAGGWHLPRTPTWLVSMGAVSGVSGTVSSIGGPPVALLYQRAEGPEVRGTLSAIFVIGSLMSIGGLALVGRFGADELRASAALVPGLLVGYAISGWTGPWLDRGRTRGAVLILSSLAAVAVVVRELL